LHLIYPVLGEYKTGGTWGTHSLTKRKGGVGGDRTTPHQFLNSGEEVKNLVTLEVIMKQKGPSRQKQKAETIGAETNETCAQGGARNSPLRLWKRKGKENQCPVQRKICRRKLGKEPDSKNTGGGEGGGKSHCLRVREDEQGTSCHPRDGMMESDNATHSHIERAGTKKKGQKKRHYHPTTRKVKGGGKSGKNGLIRAGERE